MPKNIQRPADGATYERARRRANFLMWTVALQRRRLKTNEPEDDEFIFRRWADRDFLVVALTRLRRAAILAAKVPALTGAMQKALTNFDAALPTLKKVRDVSEHFDDYAMDRGHDRRISRMSLESDVIDDGFQRYADAAVLAAEELFKDIQQAASLITRRAD